VQSSFVTNGENHSPGSQAKTTYREGIKSLRLERLEHLVMPCLELLGRDLLRYNHLG
jgi:hypothetical protein